MTTELLFISMEKWDDVWRRNQFIVAGLTARDPGTRTLFVGPARDISASVRRRELSDLCGPTTWTVPLLPNVTVTRPLKLWPNAICAFRRLNEAFSRLQIRCVCRRLGFGSPILWLNPHSAVHMVGCMGESAVIYDITDDWISLTQSPALKRLTEQQDEELCRRADAVIVCSQRLYEMKKPLTQNLYLIPNGVDSAHYAAVIDGVGPLPADAAAWPHPVLGYTGTIHPDRVDVELVEFIARGLSGGTVVLVGPNHLREADLHRLRQCGNVAITGPKSYADLPQYMRAFDVCITPHRVTPFTESLNPIKLWEYLAAGKPIVSTDVAGFRDYPALVRIATYPGEFVQAVKEALQEDPELSESRRAVARQNSWESRVDAVGEVLGSVSR